MLHFLPEPETIGARRVSPFFVPSGAILHRYELWFPRKRSVNLGIFESVIGPHQNRKHPKRPNLQGQRRLPPLEIISRLPEMEMDLICIEFVRDGIHNIVNTVLSFKKCVTRIELSGVQKLMQMFDDR